MRQAAQYLDAGHPNADVLLEFRIDWHRLHILGVLDVIIITVRHRNTTQTYSREKSHHVRNLELRIQTSNLVDTRLSIPTGADRNDIRNLGKVMTQQDI